MQYRSQRGRDEATTNFILLEYFSVAKQFLFHEQHVERSGKFAVTILRGVEVRVFLINYFHQKFKPKFKNIKCPDIY
jgi:hypothetical protein